MYARLALGVMCLVLVFGVGVVVCVVEWCWALGVWCVYWCSCVWCFNILAFLRPDVLVSCCFGVQLFFYIGIFWFPGVLVSCRFVFPLFWFSIAFVSCYFGFMLFWCPAVLGSCF